MRTKGGLEDVKCLVFSSYCDDRRSFLFLFGRHLGIILFFPLPLTPADWIGFVWPNRRGAANNLVLLVLRQYIGAAKLLAPIYWRCKHLKNPRNFLSCKMSVCLRLLVLPVQVAPIYWLYEHCSTNISPYSFVYHVVKCTVFGGFFLHVFFMATDMAPRPPPLPSVKVGTNEN